MDVVLNYTMLEGTLRFAELPKRASWDDLLDHLSMLPGLVIIESFPAVSGGWTHFEYGGHHFSIRDDDRDYWLFVREAQAPETLLMDIAVHCATVLGTRWEHN